MNDNTAFAQQRVAAAPIATRNVNLSTELERMAVVKVWDAMMRGARKYVDSEGFVELHNMPHMMGGTLRW